VEIEMKAGTGDMVNFAGDEDYSRSSPSLASQRQRKMQLAHEAGLLHKAGRNEDLERCLLQLLEIDPRDAQALFNLGVIAFKREERSRAERFLRQAIGADPDYAEAYQALGDIFYQSRHLLSAIEVYEKGLARIPTRLPLLTSLLRASMTLRSPGRVESVARRILDIDDRDTDALNYLAWALISSNGDLKEAKNCLNRVMIERPDAVAPLAQAQCLEERLGNSEAADKYRTKVREAVKSSWGRTSQAAEAFMNLGRIDLGSEVVRDYLREQPEDPQAHRYLAVTLMQDGDFVGGQDVLEQVLKIVPDRPTLQMVYCLNAFRLNDLDTFFRYHHTRWGRDGAEAKWDLPVPDWDGQPISSGKLVIQCEQGVGDYVMFAVSFPGLRPLTRDVIVKVMPRMTSLFQRSFPDFQVIPETVLPRDVPIQSVAAKTTAGDLPDLLGRDIEHLPGKAGVLVADPDLLNKLRRRYREMFPGKRLIGISWRSGNRDSAAVRSLDLPHWKPVFDLPDCAFISLQYGEITRDLEELKAQLGDRVYRDPDINPMGDMDPFTAQVAAMDMIVSVDNSTVHFAGGLGKPCWAMLPLNSDWRWQIERTDTVWYDSVELIRPDKDGGWEALIEGVAKRLATIDDRPLKAAHVAYLHRALAVMMKANRLSEAEQYGRMLLEEGEHKAEAMQAIARAASSAGRHEDAMGILNRAVELDFDNLGIRADLAIAMAKVGNPEQALRYARELTRHFPGSDEASVACGRILSDLGRYDEATDFFARPLRRDPQNVQSRLSLAGLQAAQSEWSLARGNYRKALDTEPTNATAHTALAEMELRLGQWQPGWEAFRWRFGVRPGTLPRHLAEIEPEKQPKRWTEGSLRKQRILLLAERNAAEQVVLASLLPDVAEESRRIVMECEASILPILAASFPAIECIGRRSIGAAGLEQRKIQMITSLGDLGARFRTKPADFARRAKSYLRADPERTAALRGDYLARLPGKRLVGLSWRHMRGADHGTRLEEWIPLLDRGDVAAVALHPGSVTAELAQFAEATGRSMIDDPRMDASGSLAEYAAKIAACDVVIAVEDMTALLAGALGKPVVKLRKAVDHWWWGVGDAPNPWFPNLRSIILEAEQGGEAAVRQALAHLDGLVTGT
jgi:tetratricopeptide (TPR) repeat protein